MEFSGILKKQHVEIRVQLKKKVEFPWVLVKEKHLQNFHGSWFLTLEFPKGVTQFFRISRGESFGISRGKVTNLKIPDGIFRKAHPQVPMFGFFME